MKRILTLATRTITVNTTTPKYDVLTVYGAATAFNYHVPRSVGVAVDSVEEKTETENHTRFDDGHEDVEEEAFPCESRLEPLGVVQLGYSHEQFLVAEEVDSRERENGHRGETT